MPRRIFNVLFLCTGNSARSILAEVMLNKLGGGRFHAYSAGSHPKGAVHPESIRVLKHLGYDTAQLRSKSWEKFTEPAAPQLDFIFTVCDNAAAEACPVWPGHPVSAHWGLPDPAAVQGSPEEIAKASDDTARMISQRISAFVALPFDHLDAPTLQAKLRDIGRMDHEHA